MFVCQVLTVRPAKLSQALCVSQEERRQCALLCSSAGCHFSAADPQAFGVSPVPHHHHHHPHPPELSNMAVSVTLAHSWDSGRLLPRADISYPLAVACRQPAQISWPSFLLCMEGPGLEQRCRGWNGDRAEGGGRILNRYFLSRLPLLSFSPDYQSVWCQTCLIRGARRDTKCRQILKVAADYFKSRKYRLPL